jgi:hypothetical protein
VLEEQFEIYEDDRGWRWRKVADNGEIVEEAFQRSKSFRDDGVVGKDTWAAAFA